jgi:hypothetical protein
MHFDSIYRNDINTGLKYINKILQKSIRIINERDSIDDFKIIVLESEIKEAEFFIRKQRTVYNKIRELTYAELQNEI